MDAELLFGIKILGIKKHENTTAYIIDNYVTNHILNRYR